MQGNLDSVEKRNSKLYRSDKSYDFTLFWIYIAGKKINQSPAAPAPTTGSQEPAVYRSKNKFFLAKWLGFGSK